MQKIAFDFTALEQNLNKPVYYKYADVAHKIRKVAYDIVQFVEDDIDGLWQIKNTPDGEVIIAKYDSVDKLTGDTTTGLEVKSEWKVVSDKRKEAAHVFYKDEPVTKLTFASLGIMSDEAHLACDVLQNKLAADHQTSLNLLKTLSAKDREFLYKKFPELKF